jgi:Mce-associated membrane protein
MVTDLKTRHESPAVGPASDSGADSADAPGSNAGMSSTEVDDTDDAQHGDDGETAPAEASSKTPMSPVRLATLSALLIVVTLTGLVGWLGYRTYESRHARDQRELFLQVGRQGAVNLTTIDWQHADADVKRILDGATGTFYEDFAKRSQPFVDVVEKTKSTTVGTITGAAVESSTPSDAQVLVTVSVKTSTAAAPEQDPRRWRMRIRVQKVGDQVKVSDVEFVP